MPDRRRTPLLALAAALVLGCSSQVPAQESPLAGRWKVTVLNNGQEATLWLIEVGSQDGKTTAKVVAGAAPQLEKVKVTGAEVKGDGLRLDLDLGGTQFKLAASPRPGDKEGKVLLGAITFGGNRDLVRLERTELKELDGKNAEKNSPARSDFLDAMNTKEDPARERALKAFMDNHRGDPLTFNAGLALLDLLAKKGAGADEMTAPARVTVEALQPYGPEAERTARLEVARKLTASKAGSRLALQYARQAAEQTPKDAAAAERLPALQVLARALRAAKDEGAKAIEAEITKLNDALDQEFARNAIPFKVEPFKGRKGKGGRTAVLELFTGAQCPPCVAADIAFDALLKAFKADDVVLLQYHLHIPGPDALTNRDSEKRSELYEVQGTPAVFINGKEGPQAGGFRPHAEERYNDMRSALAQRLEEPSLARLTLTGSRDGDKIDLAAEVSDLKKTGKKVRLRFALLEEVVRYPGGNGQRLHHHVVRAMPGGAEGVALEKDGKHTASADVKELRKALNAYLNEAAKRRPFGTDDRPLDLTHLRAVAFVQDDDTREILAARQVDLPSQK